MFNIQSLVVLVLVSIVVFASTEFGIGWGAASLFTCAFFKAVSNPLEGDEQVADLHEEDDSDSDGAFLVHPSRHFGFKGGAHLDDLKNFLVI
jgi:hypothetical protein